MWNKGVNTFHKGISSKNEYNSATGVRTNLLQCDSLAHSPLHHGNSPTFCGQNFPWDEII